MAKEEHDCLGMELCAWYWAPQCPDHHPGQAIIISLMPSLFKGMISATNGAFWVCSESFSLSFLLITLKILREAAISKSSHGGCPRGGMHHAEM